MPRRNPPRVPERPHKSTRTSAFRRRHYTRPAPERRPDNHLVYEVPCSGCGQHHADGHSHA